jgi:S-adenosylmethionine-diacylglycerol 3-amino-3-carboxypropyl transferase
MAMQRLARGITSGLRRTTETGLSNAVHRHPALSPAGLLERLFTKAFEGLVYPQIWEDPLIDMEALAIKPGDHIVAIASGGCNILSYLTANPARITALDLNHAHIALTRLKLGAARWLPSWRHFADFFAHADRAANINLYDDYLDGLLDPSTRRYWQGRNALGRRRIAGFAQGFYRTGLLGRFIGATHMLARLLRVDLKALVEAGSLEEQRKIFEEKVAPVFQNRLLRFILKHPASLYGLGIPPAQYVALSDHGQSAVADVIFSRVQRLACDFPLKENYFAWQAFGRRYEPNQASLPPYLQEQNFADVRARAERVDVQQQSLTAFLYRSPDRSVDCFVFLDAQDWMNDAQLTDLWTQVDRTAAPGARVIFRTAADERLLPGRVPARILKSWHYDESASRDMCRRDRSSIYGGFHLYTQRTTA